MNIPTTIKPIFTVLIGLLLSFSALSYQVSQAQIEQFKKMPKAQQQALAQSMGVDLSAIMGQINSANNVNEPIQNTPIIPRPESEGDFVKEGKLANKVDNGLDEKSENLLKAFGYDVFANAPSTFTPTTDIAIPAGYIMGPGDALSIQIFGKENADYQLTISREGRIVIPNLGPFNVVGLSFSEMKNFLVKRIKEKIIGVDVIVSIASLRSIRVFVLGDAYKPGPYTISSLSSITHALFAAGGISDIGSLRNIQLKRSGKLVTTFDLYELLIHGDSSNDLLLQSGDVIFIPSIEDRVFIEGEVRRPAIYELAKGDTFNDVLKMAGGAKPSAYLKYTEVQRYSENSYRKIIEYDLNKKAVLNTKVMPGDVITIIETEFIRAPKVKKITNSIELIGAVVKPGKYQWLEGQKISDVIPYIDTHVQLRADLQYAMVVRVINNARDIEILQFNLANALAKQKSKDNLLLQPKDKIIIFSHSASIEEAKNEKEVTTSIDEIKNTDLKQEQVKKLSTFSRQRLLMPIIDKLKRQAAAGQPIQLIEVDGEVKYPGIYPLAKNARVKDLVLAAGGVEESAYLARAELTRSQIEGIEARKISKYVLLSAALAGDNEENILLKSKDRLNIHKIPSWSKNNIIELKGEFVFPGRYTIRRGETLREVIKKAGGFTKYAHISGSVFSRVRLKKMEQENIKKLTTDLRVEMASKSITDSSLMASYSQAETLLDDLSQLDPFGRLVIQLQKIVEENDYDILLEGGDVLFVPMKKRSINVIGQVQVTSSHMFDQNLDVEDYINKSGGMKIRADDERIYIIAANGNIKMLSNNSWFSSDGNLLNPGDTIVVPLDTEYMDNITLWSTATQIIYNSAVAIAAISGI